MKTIELTKGYVALVDDEDFDYLNQFKWCVHCGYAARRMPKEPSKLLYLHKVLLPTKSKKQQVDHINMDRLDNRRSNLRLVNKSQNMRNRTKQANNTSGYKGVSLSKRLSKNPSNKMWRANICINSKSISLGNYYTAKEAAVAYNNAAVKYHGNYAKLNEILC